MRAPLAALLLAVACGDPVPVSDAGPADAGAPDSGALDSGALDSGALDSGALGPPCEPSGRRCELGTELCAWGTGACRNPGICRTIPADCEGAAVEPVCGCDGVTYESECEANRAGQSLRALGPCEP